MMPCRSLCAAAIAVCLAYCTDAFSPPLLHGAAVGTRASSSATALYAEPKGCALRPFEKKKIAVFGAGGYLGAVVFGFLQRAASL